MNDPADPAAPAQEEVLSTLKAPSLSSAVDEEILINFWRRGQIAWRDVPDATAWVERLRGNLEE